MGSLIPESEALEFESAARGESHTWRATREFALLGEILGSFEWGDLDLLMFDLPPGAERTVQYADFLGPRTSFLLVTIPSEVARGVVARSVAALSKGRNRLIGYVENMSGYYCRDCNAIKPLFGAARGAAEGLALPCLGTVPFDPELARHCDLGMSLAGLRETPVGQALQQIAQRLLDGLESTTSASAHGPYELHADKPASAHTSPELRPGTSMKFLCVPCDSPMRLQTVGPPERGSLSVVYSCPECGYEIAMLTNAYETQIVQSLGVRIGPGTVRKHRIPRAPAVRSPRWYRRWPARWRVRGRRNPESARSAQRPETGRFLSGGLRPRKPGWRIFPRSSARWREPASRDSPAKTERSKWTRRSSTPPASSSACNPVESNSCQLSAVSTTHSSSFLNTPIGEHTRLKIAGGLVPAGHIICRP